jgi:hypothetical protein
MVWGRRGRGGRDLLLIGLVFALGGCAQLASRQPPAQPAQVSQQQTASIKLPPLESQLGAPAKSDTLIKVG